MTDRITQIIDYYKINISKFSAMCGVKELTLRKALRIKGTLSAQNLEKICDSFPDIDARWLLTGKGSMICNANKNKPNCTDCLNAQNVNLLKEQVELLKKKVEMREKTIKRLQDQINKLAD